MKSNLLLAIIMLFFSNTLFGQKSAINYNSIQKWEGLSRYQISNDGRFILYGHRKGGVVDVILTSPNRKYHKVFTKTDNGMFTDDSQNIILESGSDSIAIFSLAKREIRFRLKTKSFKLLSYYLKQLLLYQTNDTLVILNLKSGHEHKITGVQEFSTVEESPIVTLKRKAGLRCVNVETFRIVEIYKDTVINTQFSARSNLLAFISKNGSAQLGIYICSPGYPAKLVVTDLSAGIESGFGLSEEPLQFSPNGNLVYFKLKRTKKYTEKDSTLTGASVDVWNWKDQVLMSRQLATLKDDLARTFTAVLNIKTGKLLQLENDDKQLADHKVRDKCVLIKNINYGQEIYYDKTQVPSYKLISLDSGYALPFGLSSANPNPPLFSPTERLIVWCDDDNYYTYEIATGITRNITQKIVLPRDISLQSGGVVAHFRLSSADWIADNQLLVKDKFDYWLLDAKGTRAPVCITEGYGRKNNIDFELTASTQGVAGLKVGDLLLLNGRHINTQRNGLFVAEINWNAKLNKGHLVDCRYSGFPVSVKSMRSNSGERNYLLVRETVENSPNLVATKDFKSFVQISDIAPEKNYNWMTSEVMHWDMMDGKPGLGLLYKPEDFDPKRKYPVIFWYYQTETKHKSNQYIAPSLCEGNLDILWYVSSGYLVFVVDISNYVPGKIASSTVNSVVSAAKYLSKFSWVNSAKMGLQGHSFGGYETNILVANTNIFAAASAAAGISNVVSFSGVLTHEGKAGVEMTEVGQFNIGTNPWSKPQVYIENSPVFKVDKITTPLLIQNNIKDNAVPFMQGVEMFTAMRRAGKRVWLLQYDGERHALGADAALDFTIRQQQFFDHYLKGKPMPVWMSRGISAKDKGIRSGLEYELERGCGETTGSNGVLK